MSSPEGQMIQIPRGAGNMTARQGAGGNEIQFVAETASAALAEKARATIESRFVMARRFPRNMDQARVKLLSVCRDPEFAEVAIYFKPIGDDGVRGPSIRMAEEISRCMGNIATEVDLVYDDSQKAIYQVSACDLEVNLTHPVTVVVQKTVERRKLRDGQLIRSQRVNSYGDIVYIVEATDDEILNKSNALISKALRTCLLRLAPDSLLSEAMKTAMATRESEDAKDPDAARKAVIDNFATIGVQPVQLVEYLAHPLELLNPKELVDLRGLFAAIRNGEATWAEAVERARARAAQPEGQGAAGNAPGSAAAAGAAAAAAKPPNLAAAAAAAKADREKKQPSAQSVQPAQNAPAAQTAQKKPAATPGGGRKRLDVRDGDGKAIDVDTLIVDPTQPKPADPVHGDDDLPEFGPGSEG